MWRLEIEFHIPKPPRTFSSVFLFFFCKNFPPLFLPFFNSADLCIMLILALVPYGYRVPSRFPLPIFVTTQLWGDFHFPVCLLSCPLQNPGQTRATSISDPNSEAEQSSLFSFFCDSSHNFVKVWFLGWGFWNLSYVWRRGANKYISLVFQLGSLVCLRCPHHAFGSIPEWSKCANWIPWVQNRARRCTHHSQHCDPHSMLIQSINSFALEPFFVLC